jgi:hypothetical protein
MKKAPLPLLLFGAALLTIVAALLGNSLPALAQNLNPQPNFSTQILSAKPSLYLNFNDLTTSFLDQISGSTFISYGTGTTNVGVTPTSLTANVVANQVNVINSAFTVSGMLSSITLQFKTAPAAVPITIAIFSGTSPSFTAVTSFTVTPAAVTTAQTFLGNGINFPTTTVSAGEFLGDWATTVTPASGTVTPTIFFLASQSTLPTGAHTYTSGSPAGIALTGVITTTSTSGTVIPRQPGFDSTQVNNTSAEFPYNGFNAAPNTTLGSSMEWDTPWTLLVHVDRLNWSRSGTLVLASKGDISSTANSYWELYAQMVGNVSQLCFTRNGHGSPSTTGGTSFAQNGECTNASFDAIPNGFNYDIVVEDSGTGNSGVAGETNVTTPAISLYLNGLNGTYIPVTAFTNTFQTSFGYATLTATGGTGFTASTAFTSTGGGVSCNVAGSIAESGGVWTGVSFTANYGCTSVPTINLTLPTGTPGTLTVGLGGALMNSSTYPLMIPGYVSAGAFNGVDAASSTQAPTYIDEAGIFASLLNQTQIQSLFYQTKFWQEAVKTVPATPYTLVFDDDSCDDSDNIFALALTIAAQKIGYIRLAGVVDTEGDGVSQAVYRQMLDQAGLAHIPMSVPSSFTNTAAGGWCSGTNANTYNASTPQVTSAYPKAKTMYRQIFANNPTTPVFIMLGGSFRGVSDLMQSSADSISSLTGAQLIAQNAANGGAIYAQGLGANITFTGDNSLADWTAGQYVVENNGAMPIYWYGGQPQITGPGVLSTRTGKDPLFLAATAFGGDTRQGYDSVPTQSFLSTLFSGGVQIAISGSGTGYAASTSFTSSGGGAKCVVTGIMLSTSGVPSSIVSNGGANSTTYAYPGLGSGCFTAASPPTIVLTSPTGTSVVLTATTTASPCGTVTITSGTSGSTSTSTCSNHYFLPYSLNASSSPTSGALMEWFINSLVDPIPGGAPRMH